MNKMIILLYMSFTQLVTLWPCYSLEDFPVHLEGPEADGLLACWTALWHPQLIAAARKIPGWRRVDLTEHDWTGALLVIPEVSDLTVNPELIEQAQRQQAHIIRGYSDRQKILKQALANLEQPSLDAAVGSGDHPGRNELIDDFLALGYCHLQIELLTRHTHYSGMLDEELFRERTVEAADNAVKGKIEEAKQGLTQLFDMLAEQRDHYYPVEAFIIDLTLVTESTAGKSLRAELAKNLPVNLLLSASVVEYMAMHEPESLSELRTAIDEGTACLIGGEYDESEIPLLPYEAVVASISKGMDVYQSYLQKRPLVFGRRRFGLSPTLPQLLKNFEFNGALHATLDGGRFPEGTQAKTIWEGINGSQIDALAKSPLDASQANTFLRYAIGLNESMDMDHVATVTLAHWPHHASPWYDDLRRVTRYGNVLGKLITLDEFLQQTDSYSNPERFPADDYRSPYLHDSVTSGQADPIGRWQRYYQQTAGTLTNRALHLMSAVADPRQDVPSQTPPCPYSDSGNDEPVDRNRTVSDFVDRLCEPGETSAKGLLIANPSAWSRRMGVISKQLPTAPELTAPVYAAESVDSTVQIVVDVPSMGYTWLPPGQASEPKQRTVEVIAESHRLRNEYMDVHIDPTTGTIRSLYDFRKRGNRLSQQIAFRFESRTSHQRIVSDESINQCYSVMAADHIETTMSSSVVGEINTRGRLLDRDGHRLADFQQTYRLWRGSRVLEITIQLERDLKAGKNPWSSYYACRFAWADPGAQIWRTINQSPALAVSPNFESPHYVEIEMPNARTAILTDGLPYHRRVGTRMLDTLLAVRGETSQTFRLGVAIDVEHPLREAMDWLTPPIVVPSKKPRGESSAWLFHLDARNVIVTDWEVVTRDEERGFRIRLLETAGQHAELHLQSCVPAITAQRVTASGKPGEECRVEDGTVHLALGAHEWACVEVF